MILLSWVHPVIAISLFSLLTNPLYYIKLPDNATYKLKLFATENLKLEMHPTNA